MIKVKDVSFKYKNCNTKILENLNFNVNDNEIVAIVGKNGSGKSTISKLLSGINKLKEGSITIDNIDISKNKNYESIVDKVGIVFQNPENQIIFNNIYNELSFSLKNLDKDEIEKRINFALEKVGMSEFKNSDLYSLSLGQKQRIMIAEVLAKNPKYIILDEPTTMLDTEGKELIHNIITKLKEDGYTIICITNIADEILLADKVLILDDGKIVEEIYKNELIYKSSLLKKYNIKLPTLLNILIKLQEQEIKIDLNNYTIDELVQKLKGLIKYEKHN